MSRPFSDAEKLHIVKALNSRDGEAGKSYGQIAKELNEQFPENKDDPRTSRGVQWFAREYRNLADKVSQPVERT